MGYDLERMDKASSPCVQFGAPADGCAVAWRRSVFAVEAVERFTQEGGRVVIGAVLVDRRERGVGRLLVATAHLKAKKGNEAIREAEAAALSARVTEWRAAHRCDAVVFGGDMNADPWEPAIRSSLGGWREAHEDPNLCEFTTCKTRPRGFVRHRIDYLFYVGPLAVRRSLYPPHIEAPGFPVPEMPSDHIPLLVEFASALSE